MVSSQSAELEALEARIRETEERLKEKQARQSFLPARNNDNNISPQRSLVGRGSNGQSTRSDMETARSPLNARSVPPSRPIVSNSSSYLTQNMPGALPQTPSEVEGNDYGAAGENVISHRRQNGKMD